MAKFRLAKPLILFNPLSSQVNEEPALSLRATHSFFSLLLGIG